MNDPLPVIRERIACGDWDAARASAESALVLQSEHSELWALLGTSLHRLNDRPGAIEAFCKAVNLNPGFELALMALATLHAEEKRYADALEYSRQATSVDGGSARAWFNRACVLEMLGRSTDALAAYDAALERDPQFAPALLNLGTALMMHKRYEEAVENNRRLVSLHPNSADAQINLAQSLLGLGRSAEALEVCDRALSLDSARATAHIDRGLALSDLGRFDEARGAFDAAETISPGATQSYLNAIAPADPGVQRAFDPILVFLYRGYERLVRCDWSARDLYIEKLTEVAMSEDAKLSARIDLPLAWHCLTVPLPAEVPQRISGVIGERYAAAVGQTGVRFGHRWHNQKIRIGYLSPDFREQLNGHLCDPLIRMHDRGRFEVMAYSIGPDDGSAVRGRIARSADRFVDMRNLSDLDAARQINSDEIDVLVDFGGYGEHCRPGIAAFRPAPVQLAHIGFPGTTGAPWIDYRITDRVVTPPGQEAFWSEKLVFMPDCFLIYDTAQAIPYVPPLREEYGLPDGAFVFCCHNNSYKIEPEIFSIWMSLLRDVPGAVLWLVSGSAATNSNLSSEARSQGVDSSRLIFAPREPKSRYMSRYRLADLFLDTPQYNAAVTACDALWMGLPVLSVSRQHFVSRQCASILSALGMPELVADTTDAYRSAAIRLATEPNARQALRSRLARARSDAPLFRAADYVRSYESALEFIVARWRDGKPPVNLRVSAEGETHPV